jgi:putative transposase
VLCPACPELELCANVWKHGCTRIGHELDAVIPQRGKPAACVSDNGSELTSTAILRWSQQSGVAWHYIAPSKPQQNAFIESFNGVCATSC